MTNVNGLRSLQCIEEAGPGVCLARGGIHHSRSGLGFQCNADQYVEIGPERLDLPTRHT